MSSFYEIVRDMKSMPSFVFNSKHDCHSHYHLSLEIFIICKAKYKIILNNQEFIANDGDIVIVDTLCKHQYIQLDSDNSKDNKDCVVLIPYKFLNAFNKNRNNKTFSSPIIHSEKLARELLSFIDIELSNTKSKYTLYSGLDFVLSKILQFANLSENKIKVDSDLIYEILLFINNNFKSEITLETLSQKFNYSKEHISRLLHAYIQVSLPIYVNKLRIDYIEREKLVNKKSITELIFSAGFKSIQTYYRVKKSLQ